ncbi:MAG: heavy metal translocating P-type ATPase [Aerococcaceae bacterium]|nr:heavy metal translocating P-type ATPase [Aerococcaceae bacterium]
MDTKQLFHVDGMNCAACAAKIERHVQTLSPVKQATVNLATDTLQVIYHKQSDSAPIIQAIEQLGYHTQTIVSATEQYAQTQALKERKQHTQRQQLIQMAALTIPLFIISMGEMVGIPIPKWLSHPLLQLCLTLPVMWLARASYISGFKQLLNGAPNMHTLVAIGTGAAFLQSVWAMLFNPQHAHHAIYFESVAVILTLMAFGKYLEELAKGKTSQAVRALMDLAPPVALRQLADGSLEEVDVAMLRVDDLVFVKPGASLAVDGVIVDGHSTIDESMITGESLPVYKGVGDTVIGASINKTGTFTYKVTRVGQQTLLSQIIQMVQDAQGSKAPIARIADQVTRYFVPIVMALAVLSALGWVLLFGESIPFAVSIMISVLIIACPCALGLATPTAIMVGTGNAARRGILIKNGAALEAAATIDTVVLDKTGTITQGNPRVMATYVAEGMNQEELFTWIASAEKHSEHPLAEAIVSYLNTTTVALDHFESITGKGVIATIQQQLLHIGNAALMPEIPEHFAQQADTFAKKGYSLVYVALNQQLVGLFGIQDPIKETSASAIQTLQQLGLRVIMLTGDNEQTAQAIAKQVGVADVISHVLPHEKAATILNLQNQGQRVMMVGDGINDAPALAQANVGVAIGAGTDIAIESADVVLMHSQLPEIAQTIDLSRATLRTIKRNLFWAFFYNVVGIPIAMGVLKLLFNGPLLNPMIAALAMSLSSVSVLLSTLLLRKK